MSTTKYGPTHHNPTIKAQRDGPHMSRHLLVGNTTSEIGRWDARTTVDSCSPEHAWKNGVDVQVLRGCPELGFPHSARYYYEETEMGCNEVILIERHDIVTTVLLVDQFEDPILKRMLRSLRGLIDE